MNILTISPIGSSSIYAYTTFISFILFSGFGRGSGILELLIFCFYDEIKYTVGGYALPRFIKLILLTIYKLFIYIYIYK